MCPKSTTYGNFGWLTKWVYGYARWWIFTSTMLYSARPSLPSIVAKKGHMRSARCFFTNPKMCLAWTYFTHEPYWNGVLTISSLAFINIVHLPKSKLANRFTAISCGMKNIKWIWIEFEWAQKDVFFVRESGRWILC